MLGPWVDRCKRVGDRVCGEQSERGDTSVWERERWPSVWALATGLIGRDSERDPKVYSLKPVVTLKRVISREWNEQTPDCCQHEPN